jgi:hypothetical protein
MSATKGTRPKARTQLQTGTLGDLDPQTTSRMLSDLGDAHDHLASAVAGRNAVVVSLAIGATRINHGLGRKAHGCTVTPTVADATWAWAMTAADDKQITITTIGAAQPNASVEIY